MARVENIVPFILKWETGTTGIGLTNEQLFEKAKLKGFANDPDDLGGATMCGVTLDTYTSYCSKKKAIHGHACHLRAGRGYQGWRHYG